MKKPNYQDYSLRTLVESDLPEVLTWRNSAKIRTNMYTDHIISLDEHRAWFKKIKCDETALYKICKLRDLPIGLVCFTNINRFQKRCFWGFYIGREENVPLGSGAAIEFIALEYAFEVLEIRKLCCEVIEFNNTVLKLHKKFGFQEEGKFINHVIKNEIYQNVIFLSFFREDWLRDKVKLNQMAFR